MKKFLRLKTWFMSLFSINKKTLGSIGEDLRKVSVTAIGVGIVGLTVSKGNITTSEATVVLVVGIILWIYGIILTKISNS
ncbi:permease [Photorhabdus caribbeanensis]|nr:permease [Photorhabdus caribbeanensis]MBS9424214.1 permease [Photorhabdus caribbeanensis]